MIEGGVPLIEAIDTIADDIDHVHFQQTLQSVSEKMKRGLPFADSVSGHPKVFDRLFCSMVLAGESGGVLTTTLERLAQHYTQKDKLGKKIKGAMSYPIFAIFFIVLIVVAIMTFIIPRFRVIFDQMGNELPLFTQLFIDFYDILRAHLVLLLLGLVGFIVFCIAMHKTKPGHLLFSKMILHVPLIGKLISNGFIVVFCRTLSTLLANGVAILDAFQILSGMTNNDVIRRAIESTRERIIEGSNLSTSMTSAEFFPNMVTKMVQVGEESGSMPKVLDHTSNYFERKVETTIISLTSVLEPILIVTVGGIVLIVVLALYLPIFSITDI